MDLEKLAAELDAMIDSQRAKVRDDGMGGTATLTFALLVHSRLEVEMLKTIKDRTS